MQSKHIEDCSRCTSLHILSSKSVDEGWRIQTVAQDAVHLSAGRTSLCLLPLHWWHGDFVGFEQRTGEAVGEVERGCLFSPAHQATWTEEPRDADSVNVGSFPPSIRFPSTSLRCRKRNVFCQAVEHERPR